MATYVLRPPDGGGLVEVSDDGAARRMLSSGYTLATPDQIAASESPVAAGVLGAARGVTFGLSDKALVSAGAKPEGMKNLRELNPASSFAGEAGATVATALATGGVRAGATLGKVVAKEAGIGGLFGAGAMVTDSALENTELTAERLATGFAAGAITSGGISAGLGLAGKGASAITKKLGGATFKNALGKAADVLEKSRLAQAPNKLKKGVNLDDVLEFSKREGVPVDFSQGGLARAKEALEAVHAKTAGVLGRLGEETAGLADDIGKTLPGRPSAMSPKPADILDDVAAKLKKRYANNPVADKEVAAFVSENLTPLKAREGLTWGQLYNVQSELRKAVGPVESTLAKEVKSSGRKALRDALFETAEKAGVATKSELLGLQKDYAVGTFLKDAIEDKLVKNQGKLLGGFQVGDLFNRGGMGAAVGGAVAGPPGAAVGAVVGAAASRGLQRHGVDLAAKAARNLASSKVMTGVGRNLKAHIDEAMRIAPDMFGGYKYILGEASARGADALLGEHARLAAGPTGSDYLSRLGLPVETADEVEAAGHRLAVLTNISDLGDQYAANLDGATKSFFEGKGGTPDIRPFTPKDYLAAKESLQEILQNPNKAFESIPPEVMASAPAVATQAVDTMLRAAKFLQSRLPTNPYDALPPALRQKWQPSASDLDRFNRVREVVESPEKALKNMAAGYLNRDQIEALRTVYPAIYEDLRTKLGERLAEWQTPLPWDKRYALSTFFGPTTAYMTLPQLQALQAATKTLAHGAEQKKGARPDGRQVVNQEKNLKTQAQRLEER